MASKKLQATVEEPLLKEMEEQMQKEKFYETSEFVKHCIRQYLINSANGINAQTRPITGILDVFQAKSDCTGYQNPPIV